MKRKLQDYVWQNCLPREFKEKVKKEYARCVKIDADDNPNLPAYAVKSAISRRALLEKLFGEHNLTSDAEEEEMLTVPRSKVQELYRDYCAERDNEEPGSHRSSLGGRIAMLQELFGSKCLPDEEPKPAEPKFKVGDEASYVCSPTLKHKCTVTKVMQNEHSGKWEYNVMFEWGKPGKWIPESGLEPYTVPTAKNPKESAKTFASNEPTTTKSDYFDCIVRDGFSKERRLNIAAMVIASIMGGNDWSDYRGGTDEEVWHNMAKTSLGVADALIKEAEKGGIK